MSKPNTFYVWLVPLLWAGCSLIHFRFPGDEYGLYAFSSIAGSWIAILVSFGDIHNPMIPISIAVTGAVGREGRSMAADKVGGSSKLED